MALTRPAERSLIHMRDIRCCGYQRADGLWDIESELTDRKTYSFANRDRGGIVAGEPVHHMHIRLTVDDDLTIHGAEASTEAGPFAICGRITTTFPQLVGLRVGPGWRRLVIERMAGVAGCTHLTELLIGPVTATVLQTVSAVRARRHRPDAAGAKPALIDSCHALASGGPVVKREWPAFYTGEEEG